MLIIHKWKKDEDALKFSEIQKKSIIDKMWY